MERTWKSDIVYALAAIGLLLTFFYLGVSIGGASERADWEKRAGIYRATFAELERRIKEYQDRITEYEGISDRIADRIGELDATLERGEEAIDRAIGILELIVIELRGLGLIPASGDSQGR